jgi:hypothetical protein
MTQINESAMMKLITEHTKKCPLCTEPETPPKRKTNVDANWEDDPGEAIGNDAGSLESAMAGEGAPRPTTWILNGQIGPSKLKQHVVTPNPHHLVPGNESLKVSNLLEWLFEGDKINADVGYDVNNAKNGVWLPSNNSMRSTSPQRQGANWDNPALKKAYVIAAMDKAHGHFHDRHGTPYSDFVTKILNKIADRLNGIKHLDVNCPYQTERAGDGRFKPPLYLYTRLNGVSTRLKTYLSTAAKRQAYVYTSKLVLLYWEEKATPHLKAK